MKRILNQIILNWFWIFAVSVIVAKNHFNWSWLVSIVTLISAPFAFIVICHVKCLGFLRFLTWPGIKYQYLKRIKKINNPFAYLVIVWVEVGGGRAAFIKGGVKGLTNALLAQSNDTKDDLIKSVES